MSYLPSTDYTESDSNINQRCSQDQVTAHHQIILLEQNKRMSHYMSKHGINNQSNDNNI